MEKLKKHVDIHLERTDKKTSVTSVTISEIRSQIYRLEATIEGNFEHMPEPDQPSWVFPGDIVKINDPEDDDLSFEESEVQMPTNGHPPREEDTATGGEPREEPDNTPQRLSPIRQYIPVGAEGGEPSLSSSTCDEEETIEEGLARYFDNPSYRAANPALLDPIEPEEDWGDTPPMLLPLQIPQGPPPPSARIQKRQRYLQKEESGEDNMNGKEIIIKATSNTNYKLNLNRKLSLCHCRWQVGRLISCLLSSPFWLRLRIIKEDIN